MHTWTTSTTTSDHTGTGATAHEAWRAALDAAAELIHTGTDETITLTVDGHSAHLQPQTETDDVTATLHTLDTMRASILANV
ncbi:hypothetical protein SAMN04487819_11680 [Actinopolyspora alba]|uniref:Uncharacterized protein n=1 Tax=Actinopolyspora alba TaxID=673379 RepID=A0A1I2BFN7_9ACTN|nr:hypothetical protein [Actinopolyspora alba]SFE54926.1 hypothetical protein SAMN04487819_11680 [Actinopolyspora alba]